MIFTKINHFVLSLTGSRRYLFSFIMGSCAVLALPPVSFFPILWMCFPALLWQLDAIWQQSTGNRQKWQAFAIGWCFAFGYFLFGLWWVSLALFAYEATTPSLFLLLRASMMPILLCAVLAVYWAIACCISLCFWSRSWQRLLVFASALCVSEWIRGHFPYAFPWNLPGYSLTTHLIPLQSVSLVGIYGLTLFALLLFSAPALFPSSQEERLGHTLFLTMLIFLSVFLGIYGTMRLRSSASLSYSKDVALAIVQPSYTPREKFIDKTVIELIEEQHALSVPALEKIASFREKILIWPETAIPTILNRTNLADAFLRPLLPKGTLLITGAFYAKETAGKSSFPFLERPEVHNAIYALSREGGVESFYLKRYLVPFGEYVPFKEILDFLSFGRFFFEGRIGLTPGPAKQDDPSFLSRFGIYPLICYEGILPGTFFSSFSFFGETESYKSGVSHIRPEWILHLSNESWFGASPALYQILMKLRVRAVETGVPVVRASNTGISAVIAPDGRLLKQTEAYEKTIITTALPESLPVTLYGRYGDVPFFVLLCAVFSMCVVVRIMNAGR